MSPGPRGNIAIIQARSITASLPSVQLTLPLSKQESREQWFSKYSPWYSKLTWELLGVQILGPHPGPTDEKPGIRSSNLDCHQPSDDSAAHSRVRSASTEAQITRTSHWGQTFTSCA